jgi:hypothetical protein
MKSYVAPTIVLHQAVVFETYPKPSGWCLDHPNSANCKQ